MRSSSAIRCLSAFLLLVFASIISSPSVSAETQVCTPGATLLQYLVQTGPTPYDELSRGTGFRGKPRHPYIEYTDPQLYGVSTKVESVWVMAANDDSVEIGWHKSIFFGGITVGPQLLMVYMIAGVPTPAFNAPLLVPEAWYRFRIQNDGTRWHWYLDSTEYVWLPYLNIPFQYGHSGGQGERDNTCTSGFARLIDLDCDGDPGFKYCYISPTEFKVRAEGVNCFDP